MLNRLPPLPRTVIQVPLLLNPVIISTDTPIPTVTPLPLRSFQPISNQSLLEQYISELYFAPIKVSRFNQVNITNVIAQMLGQKINIKIPQRKYIPPLIAVIK